MRARERLESFKRRDVRIAALNERLGKLRYYASIAPSRYGATAAGAGGTRRESGQEQFIDKIDSARQALEAEISAIVDAEKQLRAELAALPPDQRDVLTLRYLNGWSVVRVAQRMHMSDRQVIRLTMDGMIRMDEGLRS